MSVIIFGAKGLFGQACVAEFPDSVEYSRTDVDITDLGKVREVLQGKEAPVIINAAGYVNVEEAEINLNTAYAVNTIGPANLAKAAAEVGGTLVHISTDYVFDGERGDYVETDVPKPINAYGLSKLAGEQAVSAYSPKYYTLRTSALFGTNPLSDDNNFVSKRVAQMKRGDSITMVADQQTVPTSTADLASVIRQLVEKDAPYGVYHGVNSGGGVSWYEFTKEIANQVGYTGEITPVKTTNAPLGAIRPKLSTLKDTKLSALGITLPDWRISVGEYILKINI